MARFPPFCNSFTAEEPLLQATQHLATLTLFHYSVVLKGLLNNYGDTEALCGL